MTDPEASNLLLSLTQSAVLSPHDSNWPQTIPEALACQVLLQSRVTLQPLPNEPRLIAGIDASYTKTDRQMYGAIVVMSLPELAIIESAGVCGPVPFPYLPGLLSFREAPILLAALKKIRHRPDVILVDGQGIAHPRGVGLASHLGLVVGIPTIGCAKSRLWGEFGEVRLEAGSFCPLTWKEKKVGWVLRSRQGCRPLFISPGHLITVAESLTVIRQCLGKYRLPIPLRAAHILSTGLRRQGRTDKNDTS